MYDFKQGTVVSECLGKYDTFITAYSRPYEPQCEKAYLSTCAPIEDSNQSARPRNLIRIFVVRVKKLCILGISKCAKW